MDTLPVVSLSEVKENLRILVTTIDSQLKVNRDSYFKILNKIQNYVIPFHESSDNQVVLSKPETQEMISLFRHVVYQESEEEKSNSGLSDSEIVIPNLYSDSEVIEILKKVDQAKLLLSKTSPEILAVFNLLFGNFVISRGNGLFGGSVSNAIGSLWINPKNINESAEDYAEFLVHEVTHQALFLDDLVNRIYNFDTPGLLSFKCKSAILKIERGFDKSFHSAFVLASILLFKLQNSNSSNINGLIEDNRVCIQGLLQNIEAVTEHGQNRIQQLVSCMEFIENEVNVAA